MNIKSGDILFTYRGTLYTKLIKLITSNKYNPVKFTHAAIFISQNNFIECNIKVEITNVSDLKNVEDYEILRCNDLSPSDIKKILSKANIYLGKKYSFLKVLYNFLDAILGKIFLKDVYCFRRLDSSDRYVICSWVVEHAYLAANYRFNKHSGLNTPDEIYDSILHKQTWERIK